MDVPLFSPFAPAAIVAYDKGNPITASEFLNDVLALADRLPEQRFVLNLCGNRYLFAVALGAALLQRQVTLLPSSQSPATWRALASSYSGLYALSDQDSEGALTTIHVCRAGRSVKFEVPRIPLDTTALILFTSGSTGQPVPIAKTWSSLIYSAESEAMALGWERDSGLAILGTVPAQHSYGLESTVLLALHNGLVLDSAHPFFPADVCAALEALPRPRMLVTTPVHLRALCAMEEALPTADMVLSATAALSTELARQAEQRFRAPVMEIYGCSETGQLAYRRSTRSDEWTLLREVRLKQNSEGTWAYGGHVPRETLLADVIERVGDDRFLLHGRTADLVNIAGKRSSLSYLDHELNSIEGVTDGVFFMPEEEEERVVRLTAFVVAPSLTEQQILTALRNRIDPAFLPRPLHRVALLPRNATGKIPHDALKDLARKIRRDRTGP